MLHPVVTASINTTDSDGESAVSLARLPPGEEQGSLASRSLPSGGGAAKTVQQRDGTVSNAGCGRARGEDAAALELSMGPLGQPW